MSFRLKSLFFTPFALLLLSLPAFSQVTAVEGVVKDETGKPVQGAQVIFDRTDIKGHQEVKTDKKGHYIHAGLQMGTYTISVKIDGQVKDTATNVRTSPGDPKEINFDLKQSAQAAATRQAALEKAAETGELSADQTRGMTKEQKDAFEKSVKSNVALKEKQKALNDSFSAGKTALDNKQWDQAIESLNKAADLDAKQGAVWSALADAYSGKAQATPAEASADYDKCFDAYKKALEINPNEAGIYNNYALALAKDKKIDDAKVNLAKAAELDPPGAGKYYYNLGAVLVNGGQNEAAVDTFKKAIDTDPNYADAHYQYGMALAAKASTDATGKIIPVPGTVEALQKYLQLKPDGPYAASAKEMIAALGSSVAVSYGTAAAPTKKKGK